jgi:purine-nucleoside phosphorylase
MTDDNVLFFAFRYALGRKSMAVLTVVDELVKKWDSLPQTTKQQIKREIRECHDLGMDYDKQQWERILCLDMN